MKRLRDRPVALLIALAASVVIAAPACQENVSNGTSAESTGTSPTKTPATSPTVGEDVGKRAVSVHLVEFRVNAAPTTVPAGHTTFEVRNEGDLSHEFKVAKLDPGTTRPPTAANGSLDERAKSIEMIEAIPAKKMGPGYSREVTLDLERGDYVLFCNIVFGGGGLAPQSHYQMGMNTSFTVK